MEEQLVSFETAKLAKEKGFNWETLWYFQNKYSTKQEFPMNYNGKKVEHWTSKPTQSLLQKWLREVHKLFVFSEIFDKGFLEKNKFCFQYKIYDENEPGEEFIDISLNEYKTYEEVLEIGLLNALKLIK